MLYINCLHVNLHFYFQFTLIRGQLLLYDWNTTNKAENSKRSINQTINQSNDQSIKRSINQTINPQKFNRLPVQWQPFICRHSEPLAKIVMLLLTCMLTLLVLGVFNITSSRKLHAFFQILHFSSYKKLNWNKIQQHQNSTAYICVQKAPQTMNFEILEDIFNFCNKLYSYFINIQAELSSEMSLLFAPIKGRSQC